MPARFRFVAARQLPLTILFHATALLTVLLAGAQPAGAQPVGAQPAGADPATAPLRFPITRDLWVSAVGGEANGNNGGAPRLKLKSIQEMSLLDFDAVALRGKLIDRASLHLRLAGEERLWRVTVGTVSAEWVEGTGSGYQPQAGSSTFARRQHPQLPWSQAGGTTRAPNYSDLTSVTLGGGNSLWRMADAFPPDAKGWQSVAVDPDVIASRIAGLSHGLIAFDDTGSE